MKSTKLQSYGAKKRLAPTLSKLREAAGLNQSAPQQLPELPELPNHETSLRLGLAIAQRDGTPALQIAALREINRFHEAQAKAGANELDSGLSEEERLNLLNTIFGEAQD